MTNYDAADYCPDCGTGVPDLLTNWCDYCQVCGRCCWCDETDQPSHPDGADLADAMQATGVVTLEFVNAQAKR